MFDRKTVLIVEDHSIVTDGLRAIIKGNKASNYYEVVGEAKTAEGAYALCEEHEPDLVLADISLEGRDDGIRMTKSIVGKYPKTKVLMLSMHATVDYVYESMANGASGYLTKDNASEELLRAMRTVLRGDDYLDPTIPANTIKSFREICKSKNISDTDSYSLLSPREQEVFRLLADGLKISDIAETLDISPKTVDNHRARIFQKMNFHKLVDLYKCAIRIGMVDPDF